MGGLNISCGSFQADDKSGSAFESVLLELPDVPAGMKRDILSGFDNEEYVLIDPGHAASLIQPLEAYQKQLIAQIGHSDWMVEAQREEQNGGDPVKLKWGEGRGWRLYCTTNLLAACRESAESTAPVVVCLC